MPRRKKAHSRLAGEQGRSGGACEDTLVVAGMLRKAAQRLRQVTKRESPPPLQQGQRIQQLEIKLEVRLGH